MTDKTLAERLRDEMPATQSFQHSLLGDLLAEAAEAADALDAKDAEIERLRKGLQFYADCSLYNTGVGRSILSTDAGNNARAALRK